jgi:hypothetical protein
LKTLVHHKVGVFFFPFQNAISAKTLNFEYAFCGGCVVNHDETL